MYSSWDALGTKVPEWRLGWGLLTWLNQRIKYVFFLCLKICCDVVCWIPTRLQLYRRLPTISLSLRSVNMRFCKCSSRHGLLKTPCCVLTRNCFVFLCASNEAGRWMSIYSRLHLCGVCACIAQVSVTIDSFYNSNFIFPVQRYRFGQRWGPICVVTLKVL